MGYSAISFSAGEQPTTAKWNILGTNDSSFHDGSGIATLTFGTTTAVANSYKFHAVSNAVLSAFSAPTQVLFQTETFDTGNNFASSTFTAPIAGFYFLYAFAHTTNTGGDTSVTMELFKNGSAFRTIGYSAGVNIQRGVGGSIVVQAAANDAFTIFLSSTAGNIGTNVSGDDAPYFGGFYLSTT